MPQSYSRRQKSRSGIENSSSGMQKSLSGTAKSLSGRRNNYSGRQNCFIGIPFLSSVDENLINGRAFLYFGREKSLNGR
jgi:hypothetical protein